MDVIVSLFLFLSALVIYISTLAPGVYFGDSGELAAAAYNLGIAHPPGYPLYLLLGKLFGTLIPIGEFAFRMNLMSAVFAALTVGVLYAISRVLGSQSWASAGVAMIGGFGQTFWAHAVVTEVYSLAAFFFCLLLLWILTWVKTRNPLWLQLASVTAGFAMTHHISIAFYLLVLCLFVVFKQPDLLKNRWLLLRSGLCFALPMLIYLYLPLRSLADPLNDWGNPETLRSLVDHMTARQFSGMFLAHGWPGLVFQWGQFLELLREQWPFYILFLSFAGLISGFRNSRKELVLLLCLLAMNLAFSLGYFISDIDAYFISGFLLLAILTGFALQGIQSWLCKTFPAHGKRIGGILITGAAFFTVTAHFAVMDQSKNHLAAFQSTRILDSLEKNSVLFVSDEEILFPLVYFKIVKNYRPDIALYDLKQNIFFIPSPKKRSEVTMADLRQFSLALVNEGRPVYFSEPLFPDCHYQPFGLVFKMSPPGKTPPPAKTWSMEGLKPLQQVYYDELSRETVAKHHLQMTDHQYQLGNPKGAEKHMKIALDVGGDLSRIVKQAAAISLENRLLDDLLQLSRKGTEIDPFDADFHHMQGMVLHHRGSLDKALEFYNQALNFRPNDMEILTKRGLVWERKADDAGLTDPKRNWYQNALKNFVRCGELAPNHPGTRRNLARIESKLRTQ